MEKLKGGLGDNLTPKDIADKFNKDIDFINKQLKKGIEVEMEHTDDKNKAKEIAMDHLTEKPDYYDDLEQIEKEDETEEGETLNIKITNLTKNQSAAFEDMLFTMNSLGNIGSSRWVSFYADGDGNFHPKITINGSKPKETYKEENKWEGNEYRIDQDMFNLNESLIDKTKEKLTDVNGPKAVDTIIKFLTENPEIMNKLTSSNAKIITNIIKQVIGMN